MSRIVIYDPTSSIVVNRVINYIRSANTPDYSGNILVNPDVSLLTTNYLYWKVNNGLVVEMSVEEKIAIDNSQQNIQGGIFGIPMMLFFSKNTTNIFNEYINIGAIVSNKTGYYMMRNGTITALSWNSSSVADQKGSIIIQNNYIDLISIPIVAGENHNIVNSLSYNFNQGENLSCYISGGKIDNAVVLIEFIWRL